MYDTKQVDLGTKIVTAAPYMMSAHETNINNSN
jgi:hypothetical protein